MATMSESTANLASGGVPGATSTEAAQVEVLDSRRNFNYPLVRYCDMPEEMKGEVVDMVVSAVEKYSNNYEASANLCKELMDKKYGSSWHVVIGEGYSFEITHEMRNLMYMYVGGLVGILLWKAS